MAAVPHFELVDQNGSTEIIDQVVKRLFIHGQSVVVVKAVDLDVRQIEFVVGEDKVRLDFAGRVRH